MCFEHFPLTVRLVNWDTYIGAERNTLGEFGVSATLADRSTMPSSSSILWYLILIEDVRCVATGTAFNGDSQMSDRQFRIGVVGLGTAARMMLPALAAHRGMVLAAVADPVREVRESVGA